MGDFTRPRAVSNAEIQSHDALLGNVAAKRSQAWEKASGSFEVAGATSAPRDTVRVVTESPHEETRPRTVQSSRIHGRHCSSASEVQDDSNRLPSETCFSGTSDPDRPARTDIQSEPRQPWRPVSEEARPEPAGDAASIQCSNRLEEGGRQHRPPASSPTTDRVSPRSDACGSVARNPQAAERRRAPTLAGSQVCAARDSSRGHRLDGERERHDSARVRQALTAATPEWAQSPTKYNPAFKPGGCSSAQAAQRESEGGGQHRDGDTGPCGYPYRIRKPPEGGTLGSDQNEGSFTPVSSVTGWTSPSTRDPTAGQPSGRDGMARCCTSPSGAGVSERAFPGRGQPQGPTVQGSPGQDAHAPHAVAVEGSSEHATDSGPLAVPLSSARNAGVGASPAATAREGGPGTAGRSGVTPEASAQLSREVCASRPHSLPDTDARRRSLSISTPFATEALDSELRPVRELERHLMLLQMEMSQVCPRRWPFCRLHGLVLRVHALIGAQHSYP